MLMLEKGCAAEEPASLYKLFLEQSIRLLETFAAEACGTILPTPLYCLYV